MKDQATISKDTELKPSDIIRNQKGKIFRIDSYYSDKNSFRIYPWPLKPGDDNPPFTVVTRDSLVQKKWQKADPKDLKDLPAEPVVQEEEVEKGEDEEYTSSPFIKEEKYNGDETADYE